MTFARATFATLAAILAVTVLQPSEASAQTQKQYAKKYKSNGPLRGTIYGNRRRPGGYSYKYSDVITPGSRYNPAVTGMYDSGVIDSDFFYPRPSGPFGGYTPYMH